MAIIFCLIVFIAQNYSNELTYKDEKVVNAVEAEGGRLYSYPVSAKFLRASILYSIPVFNKLRLAKVSLDDIKKFGFMRGFSVPPGRVIYLPGGRARVLPAPPFPLEPVIPCTIYHGDRSKRRVALTFDSSDVGEPQARRIIEILNDYRVPATFFICGPWCEKNSALLISALDSGIEFGSHSWTHRRFTTLTSEEIDSELKATEAAFSSVSKRMMAGYFRPPYGDTDLRVESVCANAGYKIIMWDVDPKDWMPGLVPGQVRDRVLEGAKNGSIILMHLNSNVTAYDLPEIIANLRSRGFELTTLSGVLEK